MEEYTAQDVIDVLKSIYSKDRKRVLVDQRSYLIGILAYKFRLTEDDIAKHIGAKRDTIHYNKKIVLNYYNYKPYMQNVNVYSNMFPFDFKEPHVSRMIRSQRIQLDINTKVYKKLKVAGDILGHKDIRTTINFFLEKSLKLWEK